MAERVIQVTARPGVVVASYGRRLLVEDEQGERHQCVPRGRRLRAVCGDRVRWEPAARDGDGLVVEIQPRSTELERPDSRGHIELLAANLTQIIAVLAPRPPPDLFLVDRYLAAARLMSCEAAVVSNKCELEDAAPGLASLVVEYTAAGYEVISTSAKTGVGLDVLRRCLAGHTSILVGQSGVGKSSLLNALVPGLDAATDTLSTATGRGRHTTTVAVLHHMPGGGDIVDSPGVRDYAPPPIEPRQAARGYVEMDEPSTRCRFADCLHDREPDCAVKADVAAGQIPARRYESYRRLLHLMVSLAQER